MKILIWIAILNKFTVHASLSESQIENSFSWENIVDLNDKDSKHDSKNTKPQEHKSPFHIFIAIFHPVISIFQSHASPTRLSKINDSRQEIDLSSHVRRKRASRRSFIVKCCGTLSCSDGNSANIERREQDKKKKNDEVEFIDELQYSRPKKKRKKQGNLNNLRAYGVFTDSGIHISCAGCPQGWPDMLTVYPEYEIGIPVSCSNCPNNWPGALNLLGIGGDPAWAQTPPPYGTGNRNYGNRRGGNNFFAFDPGSNFGGNPDNVQNIPPVDFGNGFGQFPANGGSGGGGDDYDYPSDETTRRTRRPSKKKTTKADTYDEDDEEEGGSYETTAKVAQTSAAVTSTVLVETTLTTHNGAARNATHAANGTTGASDGNTTTEAGDESSDETTPPGAAADPTTIKGDPSIATTAAGAAGITTTAKSASAPAAQAPAADEEIGT